MFGCVFDFVGFGFTDGFMLLRNETFSFRELSGANTVDRPADKASDLTSQRSDLANREVFGLVSPGTGRTNSHRPLIDGQRGGVFQAALRFALTRVKARLGGR